MGEPRRSIVREHAFENSLGALIPEAFAADEFVEAAEFILSADPLIGSPLTPGSSLWVLPMSPIGGRMVALYYTFDEQTVWFIAIGPTEGA